MLLFIQVIWANISKILTHRNGHCLEFFDASNVSRHRFFRIFENAEYSEQLVSKYRRFKFDISYPIQSITRKFGSFETFNKSGFDFSEITRTVNFSNNNYLILVFDVTIILTILINCVFLALDDPVDELEYVFTAIYTLEVVIKVNM